MSAENETIADIVAEKRREAQFLIESAEESARCGKTMADTPYTEENLENARQDAKEMLAEADRIEAAAKRMEVMHNRETEHYKQERNEAPAKERKRLQDNGFLIIRKEDAVGDAAKLRKALSDACYAMFNFLKTQSGGYEEMANALDKAKAALAAPPRNCDKYPTFNDAIRALADKREWHDAKWDSERYCILASWLYALATEQKGATNDK